MTECQGAANSQREADILSLFEPLADSHVEASGGALDRIDIDISKYPAQAAYSLDGNPVAPEIVEGLASIAANPHFPSILELATENPKTKLALEQTAEILERGDNVALVTNHGYIIDIGIAEAAVCSRLKRQNREFRSGIIISKMVTLMAYRFGQEVIPAPEALKMLCDRVYLSYPRTESMKEAVLNEDNAADIALHNTMMSEAIGRDMDKGGLLLAFAPSGTTDKLRPDNSEVVLSKVGNGTARMMKHPKTFLLPMAIWLKGEAPVFEASGDVLQANNDDDIHLTMHTIADTLNRKVAGHTFMYQDS